MRVNIPCKYRKHDGTGYLSQQEASVVQLNCKYASTVTSHYWRGISSNMDNIVLVVETNEDNNQRKIL